MKFDTVIIGGGLSGLACGIALSKAGKKCVIVSSGQSALHFSSGSFDLLNTLPDGTPVHEPVKALPELFKQNPSHPYAKIGSEQFSVLADEAQKMLDEAGIHTKGSFKQNHYRITPLALSKSTWLTMQDFVSNDQADTLQWKSVALFNFMGYLDFYPTYLADAFRQWGVETKEYEIDLSSVEAMRRNPSEFRSTNIARLFDEKEAQENLVQILKSKVGDSEAILLPACLGLDNPNVIADLSRAVGKTIQVLATFPPSVAGIRAQLLLKQKFMQLGGIYMLGDTVNKVEMKEGRVYQVYTVNHGDIPIKGDEFVLSSGSFFSQGLVALPDKVIDPICNLDVDYLNNRQDWYTGNVYDKQNYQSFGIKTDPEFLAIKEGKTICNLHVCGASLGGFDALKEGCGSGVSLLTALYVAGEILNKR
jgi:glycerol-3-phosphate dehydrogenase subunit B